MEAYCVKCKEKVTQKSPKPFITERGMKMSKGKCPYCGTNTCVAVKHVDGWVSPKNQNHAASVKRNSSQEIHERNLGEVKSISPKSLIERSFIAGFKAAEKKAIEGSPLTALEIKKLSEKHASDSRRVPKDPKKAEAKENPKPYEPESRLWIIVEDDPFSPTKRYWNASAGWTESKSKATKYSYKQMRAKKLPENGEWQNRFIRKTKR